MCLWHLYHRSFGNHYLLDVESTAKYSSSLANGYHQGAYGNVSKTRMKVYLSQMSYTSPHTPSTSLQSSTVEQKRILTTSNSSSPLIIPNRRLLLNLNKSALAKQRKYGSEHKLLANFHHYYRQQQQQTGNALQLAGRGQHLTHITDVAGCSNVNFSKCRMARLKRSSSARTLRGRATITTAKTATGTATGTAKLSRFASSSGSQRRKDFRHFGNCLKVGNINALPC